MQTELPLGLQISFSNNLIGSREAWTSRAAFWFIYLLIAALPISKRFCGNTLIWQITCSPFHHSCVNHLGTSAHNYAHVSVTCGKPLFSFLNTVIRKMVLVTHEKRELNQSAVMIKSTNSQTMHDLKTNNSSLRQATNPFTLVNVKIL